MAKTLEEFFIQQIENKEIEIDALNDKIKDYQTLLTKASSEREMFFVTLRAFLFMVNEGKITCDSNRLYFGEDNIEVPYRFVSDFFNIKDYMEHHFIVEENGKVRVLEDGKMQD